MSEPIVSIVMPNKNRWHELAEAISSIQAQTLSAWELIIIDDRSDDGTVENIKTLLDDARLHFVTQDMQRTGAPAARNEGARRARGRYVIFFDNDDLLAPTCLERRVRAMESDSSLDFTVSACEMFRKRPGDVGLLWNADTGESDLDRFIRHDVPWQTSGPTWRRGSLAKVGEWDERALSAQDWEFHLRAVLGGLKYRRLGEVDYYWRMAGEDRGSIGKSAATRPDYHRSRFALYQRICALVRGAGELSPARKPWFAGMYFTAAEKLGLYASRREARAAWSQARADGLVSGAEYRQGLWTLLMMKWPATYERARKSLETKWPPALLLTRGSTFMNTPVSALSRTVAEVA